MKIAVMGSGGWGTALALVLLENGHEVTLWSYREEESTILREKRENPMLKGVPLPDGLALTSDRECVKNCKVVVLATPSFAVRTTALMTRGLTEIARLGVALGGRRETCAGLSGVGDLIVTCTSMHSRNRRCGILIGQGTPAAEAVKEIGAVVEGYYAAATARALAQKAGVEMPITEAAYQVLYGGRDTRAVIKELMTRARKHELEDSWV